MFERFDQDARAAIAKAREEAARAGSREIRTEHLLLGLMDKPGDATDVLEAVQADPEEVRAAVPQVEAARLAAADTANAPETAADTAAADTGTAPVPEAGLPPEVTLAAEAPPGEPGGARSGSPAGPAADQERPPCPRPGPAHRPPVPPRPRLLRAPAAQHHRAARLRCRRGAQGGRHPRRNPAHRHTQAADRGPRPARAAAAQPRPARPGTVRSRPGLNQPGPRHARRGSVTLVTVDTDAADPAEPRRIPDPALVVLVGASGSGKSAWAAAYYRATEVVSSDRLRAVVGSGERDLDASADAFSLLDQIVAARTRRGLATVIDTLGLDPERRRGYLDQARRSGLPAVAVLFDTDPGLCRERNRARAVAVPAAVLDAQLRRVRAAAAELAAEDWDVVVEAGPARLEPAHTPARHDLREPARPGAGGGTELHPARVQFSMGRGPGRVAALGRRGGQRSRVRGPGADGPPDPDSAGRAGLGAHTRALGHARPAGRAGHRPAAGHAGQPGDVPRGRRAGQDRRHPRRADRRPGLLRARRGLVGPGARRVRPAVPARRAAPGPARADHRDDARAVAAGHQGLSRRARRAARDDVLPATGQRHPDHRRRFRRTPYPGRSRPASATAATCPRPTCPPWTASWPCCASTAPRPAAIRPACRSPCSTSRWSAPTASTRPTWSSGCAAGWPRPRSPPGTTPGSPRDHIDRYRLLAQRGVGTVFVALPDLAGPDEVRRLAPVTAAFR